MNPQENKPELYRKVYIKTVDDLPERGWYFIMTNSKDGFHTEFKSLEPVKNWWLNKVEYYLQPVEQPEPEEKSDEQYLTQAGLKALRVLRTILKKADLQIGYKTANIMIGEFEDYLNSKTKHPEPVLGNNPLHGPGHCGPLPIDYNTHSQAYRILHLETDRAEQRTAEEILKSKEIIYSFGGRLYLSHNIIDEQFILRIISAMEEYRSQSVPEITDKEIEKAFPINYPHERHDIGLQRDAAKWYRSEIIKLKA